MKRMTYLVLSTTILLLLLLCRPIMGSPSHVQTEDSIVSPSDDGVVTLAEAAPMEITEIEVDKFTVNRIHLLMRGESSALLDFPQLDGKINFYREGEGFAEKNVCYSINYDTEDFDNTYGNQIGLFFLKASIVLEDERYVMASDVITDIFIPVFLYDPDQPSYLPPLNPNLNKYNSMKTFHIITEVHTDLQQVEEILNNDFTYQRFYVYFENGYYLNLPNSWDLSSVETSIPGIYPAYRRPDLPQGLLMENSPEDVYSINIQDPQIFTLSSPVSYGNNIVVKWLYPTPDLSLFRLQYRIGNGDWIVDTEDYFMHIKSDRNGQLSLFLNPWEMEKDIHYQFQLEYDGVYSNILELCVNKDGFYIPNEGDEDGGDRNTQTPPDVIQPSQNPSEPEVFPEEEISPSETAPDNPSDDDPVAAISDQMSGNEALSSPRLSAPTESDTSTASTWSGRRIKEYLKAYPGLPLVFEKDLIRMTMPADSPAFLSLADSDSLHVEIQALSADTLSLTVSLNEIPLVEIPMTVTMPWTGDHKPKDLQVEEESGTWVAKVDESDTEGSITFTVTQSGVYTILPSPSEETIPEEETVPEEETTSKAVTDDEGKTDTQSTIEPEILSKQASANILPVKVIPALLILGSITVIVFLQHKRKKE